MKARAHERVNPGMGGVMETRVWHQHYDEGVPTSIEYPQLRLDELLTKTAAAYPEHPALLFMGSSITYSDRWKSISADPVANGSKSTSPAGTEMGSGSSVVSVRSRS